MATSPGQKAARFSYISSRCVHLLIIKCDKCDTQKVEGDSQEQKMAEKKEFQGKTLSR